MKLEKYLLKYGWTLDDQTELEKSIHPEKTCYDNGSKLFWVWGPNSDDSEPEFFLFKSPNYPNYQVRNFYSKTLRSGQMITDQELKNYIVGDCK